MVDLEVIVPDSYTGDIMGDLNSKRGKIQGMDQIGGGKQRIRALVPQAEVARYVIDLRSMTGGRGAYTRDVLATTRRCRSTSRRR